NDATGCYSVTTTLYVAGLLGLVSQVTGNALSVTPRTEACAAVITNMNTRIIHTATGANPPELKAWQALMSYLGRLPPEVAGGATPTVPAAYAAPQLRVVTP